MQIKKAVKVIPAGIPASSALEKVLDGFSADAQTNPRELVLNFVTPEGGE